MVGWLGVLGWQTAAATVSYLAGKTIQGMIKLNNPDYTLKAWHGTLLIWSVLAICWVFNTLFSRNLPLIEGVIVILHVAGFFAVIIPLWIMGDRSAASGVFTSFQDNMMWGNLPLAVIIGLTVLMLIIAIFACVAVMATNSRQLFAFARDNGIPFSKVFSKASPLTATVDKELVANLVIGFSHA
jgi:MFS superfamily sulfate permease-like transporter